jgi:hypothetical protein
MLILSLDLVFEQTWRGFARLNLKWLGVAMEPHQLRQDEDQFAWRHGKHVVLVKRAGGSWQVMYLSQGRLLGPRTCVYEATHRQAKHAAWDVMARVISASHDEEEAIEAAVQAAQWMRKAERRPGMRGA